MVDNFNEIEEKNTNNFALVVGVALVSVVVGVFSFVVILASSDKVEHFWDMGRKSSTLKETVMSV